MNEADKICKYIRENKEKFQVNFLLMRVKEKSYGNKAVMINIDKYQANQILSDDFYKRISRIIL